MDDTKDTIDVLSDASTDIMNETMNDTILLESTQESNEGQNVDEINRLDLCYKEWKSGQNQSLELDYLSKNIPSKKMKKSKNMPEDANYEVYSSEITGVINFSNLPLKGEL